MRRIPEEARRHAESLRALLSRDAELCTVLNAAHDQLNAAADALDSHGVRVAFARYQGVWEDRRQLAADVGERTIQLVAALTPAGFTEHEARNVNVGQIAQGISPDVD